MLAMFLLLAAAATATLSGIFGMAGGLILMAIYAALLPIPTAMVLHGITQLAANGSRAWLHRRAIEWRVVGFYCAGAGVSAGLFALLGIVLSPPAVFLTLGGVPLAVSLLPARVAPRVDRPAGGVLCGLVVTAALLLAGASGPLLDAFYVRSGLDRHRVIATKAFTQSLGHALKWAYFGWWFPAGALDCLPGWLIPALALAALGGTHAGARVLDRLSEQRFRTWTASLVRILSVLFVARGLAALAGGGE